MVVFAFIIETWSRERIKRDMINDQSNGYQINSKQKIKEEEDESFCIILSHKCVFTLKHESYL